MTPSSGHPAHHSCLPAPEAPQQPITDGGTFGSVGDMAVPFQRTESRQRLVWTADWLTVHCVICRMSAESGLPQEEGGGGLWATELNPGPTPQSSVQHVFADCYVWRGVFLPGTTGVMKALSLDRSFAKICYPNSGILFLHAAANPLWSSSKQPAKAGVY